MEVLFVMIIRKRGGTEGRMVRCVLDNDAKQVKKQRRDKVFGQGRTKSTLKATWITHEKGHSAFSVSSAPRDSSEGWVLQHWALGSGCCGQDRLNGTAGWALVGAAKP